MCPDFGTPKNNKFSLWNNGKFIILGVPILKHITLKHIAFIRLCLESIEGHNVICVLTLIVATKLQRNIKQMSIN